MQCQRPGGASALDPDGGQVPTRQAGVIQDEGGDVLLVEERARRHVPEEESPQVGRGELRVDERLKTRLDADLPERAVPQLSELRLAHPEHRDFPHRYSPPMWILPRNFA